MQLIWSHACNLEIQFETKAVNSPDKLDLSIRRYLK